MPQDRAIIVDLSPSVWFKQGADVVNLASLDGQLVEFQVQSAERDRGGAGRLRI